LTTAAYWKVIGVTNDGSDEIIFSVSLMPKAEDWLAIWLNAPWLRKQRLCMGTAIGILKFEMSNARDVQGLA